MNTAIQNAIRIYTPEGTASGNTIMNLSLLFPVNPYTFFEK